MFYWKPKTEQQFKEIQVLIKILGGQPRYIPIKKSIFRGRLRLSAAGSFIDGVNFIDDTKCGTCIFVSGKRILIFNYPKPMPRKDLGEQIKSLKKFREKLIWTIQNHS